MTNSTQQPDLDNLTLFGEVTDDLAPWPAGYGSRPQPIERTLFGELSFWRSVAWPEGYGSAQ